MIPLWKTEALLDTSLNLLQEWKEELIEKFAMLAIVGVAAFVTLAAATAGATMSARAASSESLTQDRTFVVRGRSIAAVAGSSFAELDTSDPERFVVTLEDGDAVMFRLVGYGQFVGITATVAGCRFHENANYLAFSAPGRFEFSVEDRTCDSSSTPATVVAFAQPQAGARVASGTEQLALWQTSGAASSVRVSLSVDGGRTYPDVLEANRINDGALSWTVPAVASTDRARLKVEALGEQETVLGIGVSDLFSIDGVAQPPTEPTEPTGPAEPPTPPTPRAYSPSEATQAATSIGADRRIAAAASGTMVPCAANARIRGASSSAVYYCGADGKRYAFPNQRVHDSWYQGFEGIAVLTDAELAAVPLGGTVTYRPGVRMVKITTDPKTYAVAADGELRWVTSEEVAVRLYGPAWNTLIDDLPDAFFAAYRIGDPIE